MGLETAGWGGGLAHEGMVVEKFVPALESLSSLGLEGRNLGCPGKFAGMPWTLGGLSGPDPLRFLRVALRIEISTRCVFCVAGRIFIGFLSLPNLVLKLNLNMPKRLRVEAAYRSKTLAYCGSNPRFETSGPANSSTKMAY